ncbi:MAG: response regulator [Candidatus Eiseniibacteriota bacterium]|nr:MAG: response regulator [Candidatus Eisenbacteria bacterium]
MRTSILVAESDPALAGTFVETFTSDEYEVKAVSGLREALDEIQKERPDVVLVSDRLSDGQGLELCRRILERWGQDETCAVVLLTGDSKRQELHGGSLRLDACLPRPVDPVLLKSVVESLISRRRRTVPCNPLTKLPNAAALSQELQRRKSDGERFATCLFTLGAEEAAAYRSKYGELKFTGVIKLAARTVAACALAHGGKQAFVAHRGTLDGPEFIVLMEAEKAAELERAVCQEFDAGAELLYNSEDREAGCLLAADETGKKKATPFVSLSMKMEREEKVGVARAHWKV